MLLNLTLGRGGAQLFRDLKKALPILLVSINFVDAPKTSTSSSLLVTVPHRQIALRPCFTATTSTTVLWNRTPVRDSYVLVYTIWFTKSFLQMVSVRFTIARRKVMLHVTLKQLRVDKQVFPFLHSSPSLRDEQFPEEPAVRFNFPRSRQSQSRIRDPENQSVDQRSEAAAP